MLKFRLAQGVVESVFSVGILVLLLSGAIILIVLGISNRRNSFDRRKATELATIVTEDLITRSQNSPEEFWQYNNVEGLRENGFDDYTYSITFTNVSGNATYPKCGEGGKVNCAEVVIKIDWQGKVPQSLYFNRFFSKNEN